MSRRSIRHRQFGFRFRVKQLSANQFSANQLQAGRGDLDHSHYPHKVDPRLM